MRTADRLFALLIAAFVAFFLAAGILYYHYETTVIRFPLMVGVLVIALALIQLVRGPRADGAVEPKEEAETLETPRAIDTRELFGGALWLLAILPAVWLLGYPAGITLYLLAYLKAHGEGWVLSIVVALVGLAVVWLLFVQLFAVRLPLLPVGFG